MLNAQQVLENSFVNHVAHAYLSKAKLPNHERVKAWRYRSFLPMLHRLHGSLTGFATHRRSVDGRTMVWLEGGNPEGSPVVLLHGFSSCKENWLPLLPIFMVYLISGVAETNRHPFDVVEGEAEIVAGHMVEYSGMGFAIFFLAEYASMWLVSILAVLMFLGGWLPPIDSALFNWIPGWIWLGLKTFFVVSLFIWIRATFPRFRYDQIMRLGWKIFIPVTLVWLLLVGALMQTPWNIWQ